MVFTIVCLSFGGLGYAWELHETSTVLLILAVFANIEYRYHKLRAAGVV